MFKPIARFVSFSMLLSATALFAQPPQPPATAGKAQGSSTTAGSSTGSSSSSSSSGTSSTSTSTAKKIEPGSLEDLLDKALSNNPDIRAADAKVREAEAQLNRVRHQVVAKVVGLRNDLDLSKKMLGYSERNVNRIQEHMSRGLASRDELEAATTELEKRKAEVAKLQGDMDALTGSWKHVVSAAFSPDGQKLYSSSGDKIMVWDVDANTVKALTWTLKRGESSNERPATIQTPMADRIRAGLNKNVKINVKAAPFSQALSHLFQTAGIPVRSLGKIESEKIEDISFSTDAELPLGAWLQVLQDSAPNVRFVVRDYGILVTTRDRVPDGAMTVEEFWKQDHKPKVIVPELKKP